MTDKFTKFASGLTSPASDAFSITPNDGVDLNITTRAVYVGGGGNMTVTTADGNDVTFTALPQGTLLPLRVQRVFATNTTATDLVGMY